MKTTDWILPWRARRVISNLESEVKILQRERLEHLTMIEQHETETKDAKAEAQRHQGNLRKLFSFVKATTALLIFTSAAIGQPILRNTYSTNNPGQIPPSATASNMLFLPDILVMSNDVVAPSSALWTQYLFNSPNPTNFQVLGASAYGQVGGPFGVYYFASFDQTGGSNTRIQPASASSIAFGIDSDQFIVRNSGSSLKVVVDNVDNFVVFTVPGGGTEYWTYVIFSAKQPRSIQLEGLGYFYSVYVPITNGFLNVQPIRNGTLALLGDSFTEEDFFSGSKAWGPSTRLSELYPQWNLVALGEGGTGWLNPGIGNGYGQGTNFLGRAQDVIRFNPNAVIIWGGINDAGNTTNTSQTNIVFNAATNVLATLRAALPSAPIFVIGPQFGRAPAGGDTGVTNEAVLLAVACGTIANCTYINPIAEPWITGNVAIPGSGNAVYYTLPSDTTHPTILGSGYYAKRIFGAINSGLVNLTPNTLAAAFNFVSGAYYTNGLSTPVQVSCMAELSQAAVAGNVQLSLWILGSVTNFVNQQTLGTSLVTTNTALLQGMVPPGAAYTFTNQSVGAGNSTKITGSQLIQF